MARKMSDEVAQIAEPTPVSSDKLEKLRDAVRKSRDLHDRLTELEEQVSNAKKEIHELEFRELPDLFQAAGVDRVGLPQEGNHPAYDALLQAYYHANIPTANKEQAFSWLENEGFGDIIKSIVTVELGRGERALAKKLESKLQQMGIDYSTDLNVHWKTLTAWLKERIAKQDVIPPLDLIGATVSPMVKLKERRD